MENIKTIFIGALPYKTTVQFLAQTFQPFGIVGEIKIFANWENPTHEPYALITVNQPQQAVEQRDGFRIGSSHLRVHINQGV